MDRITLHRMTFYGYHGVFPEERKLGQRFVVDVDIYADLRQAGRQDDLGLTINYAEAYSIVERIACGEPFQLIEALAEHIAQELLQAYTVVQAVTVKVTKPQPPFAGAFEGVSVELTRKRADRDE